MLRASLVTAAAILLSASIAACKSTTNPPDGPSSQPSGGSTGGGTTTAEKPCAATAECVGTERCTTEQGVCDRPPGCGPNDVCANVCYGTCHAASPAEQTGAQVDRGQGGGAGAPAPAACTSDDQCVAFSDYCTGCDCRALGKEQAEPKCSGPGVRCIADPCRGKKAACVSGTCAIVSGAPAR